MNVKYINMLNWLALLLAVGGALWVLMDIYKRYQLAGDNQQEFSFGNTRTVAVGGDMGLGNVINSHLFGTVPIKTKQAQTKAVETPKTKLSLKLTGVIDAVSAGESRAIIELKPGQTSVVGVGEKIGKTGATLHKVESDHIIIEYRGSLEKLLIERNTLKISDLANSKSSTIAELNINIAEFEALARVNEAEAKRAEAEMQAYLNQSSQAKAEPQVEPDSGNNEQAKTEQAKSEQNTIGGVNVPSMLPKE